MHRLRCAAAVAVAVDYYCRCGYVRLGNAALMSCFFFAGYKHGIWGETICMDGWSVGRLGWIGYPRVGMVQIRDL
jgi:hypothetical protein